MPPCLKTWEVFGDADSADYLSSAATLDQYRVACHYFHARLALVARGFAVGELEAIFNDTMPNYIREGHDVDRSKGAKEFERAYNWIQDRLVERLCAYAYLWLETEGGKDYKNRESRAT